MKMLMTLTALTLTTGIATAGDFGYERQLASPDLSFQPYHATAPSPSVVQPVISLHEIYRGNPDNETVPEGFQHSISGQLEAQHQDSYDRLVSENPDLGA